MQSGLYFRARSRPRIGPDAGWRDVAQDCVQVVDFEVLRAFGDGRARAVGELYHWAGLVDQIEGRYHQSDALGYREIE